MLQAGQHEELQQALAFEGSVVFGTRGVVMRAPPITITITVAILVTGCWQHPHAQVAPNVPALEPSTARDLEGKVVREIASRRAFDRRW